MNKKDIAFKRFVKKNKISKRDAEHMKFLFCDCEKC